MGGGDKEEYIHEGTREWIYRQTGQTGQVSSLTSPDKTPPPQTCLVPTQRCRSSKSPQLSGTTRRSPARHLVQRGQGLGLRMLVRDVATVSRDWWC